jgi:large subunit ribosomal protein L31
MKAKIHPVYYDEAEVICVCGNKFTTGSTQKTIRVELCSKCHPFYTGEQRFIDSGSLIQKFQKKQQIASVYQENKQIKVEEKKKKIQQGPLSLRDMIIGLK